MNGGKLYYTLITKLNNDLIKIIQSYTINVNKKGLLYEELLRSTKTLWYQLDTKNTRNVGYNKFNLTKESRWYLYSNE